MGLINLYEQNGVVIHKSGNILKGLKKIEQHLENLLALKPKIVNKIQNTLIVGDTAILFSEWYLEGTSVKGEPINATGQSFDILSRQTDGRWLILVDSPYGNRPK
jgi:uncharacterized protein (TIGR02246 family)